MMGTSFVLNNYLLLLRRWQLNAYFEHAPGVYKNKFCFQFEKRPETPTIATFIQIPFCSNKIKKNL